jgi:hypothetical protein
MYFFHDKVYVLILTKIVLGYTLADFFINTSGQPDFGFEIGRLDGGLLSSSTHGDFNSRQLDFLTQELNSIPTWVQNFQPRYESFVREKCFNSLN